MPMDLEKAQIMFKLTRKNNWNACYDRLEHFKRFNNLDLIIKELVKLGWVILHKKPNYEAISLNTKHKKEIIEFIELKMPYLRGMIK
jgi:hypothetical protein